MAMVCQLNCSFCNWLNCWCIWKCQRLSWVDCELAATLSVIVDCFPFSLVLIWQCKWGMAGCKKHHVHSVCGHSWVNLLWVIPIVNQQQAPPMTWTLLWPVNLAFVDGCGREGKHLQLCLQWIYFLIPCNFLSVQWVCLACCCISCVCVWCWKLLRLDARLRSVFFIFCVSADAAWPSLCLRYSLWPMEGECKSNGRGEERKNKKNRNQLLF